MTAAYSTPGLIIPGAIQHVFPDDSVTVSNVWTTPRLEDTSGRESQTLPMVEELRHLGSAGAPPRGIAVSTYLTPPVHFTRHQQMRFQTPETK
ncbi:hypothetical protein CPLU01_14405 [Colletotrichum plurivorum]|uniref:Uncharacterized protein n=1 Tax=Colletotrichum plurivorum TaxID=2175906 RepID=A0A8H6JK51_9PEZI|nr:hypothetical protein CPLU01_14405 [Colletotrichum plurivorum]